MLSVDIKLGDERARSGAFLAETLERNFVVRYDATVWKDELSGIVDAKQGDILHLVTFLAEKMAVFLGVWAVTRGSTVEIHLLDQPARNEGFQTIVNGGERN